MQIPHDDELLERTRSLASAGAWSALARAVQTYLDASPVTPAIVSPGVVVLYAEALMRTGHPVEAEAWLTERDGALRLSGDRAVVRRAANLLGAACLEQAKIDRAHEVFTGAVDIARADGDDLLLARSMNNLAVIATIRGRLPEALGLYKLAIPAYQRIGNVNGIAESHHNTAITLRKLQRLEHADEHERRSAEFARQVSNQHLVALTRVGRAEIFLLKGDAALAEATALRAATELGAIPDPARQADALRLCAAAQWTLGRLAEALASLDEAVPLAAEHGNRLIEAECRFTRAQVCWAMGDHQRPLDDAQRAADIFRTVHAPTEMTTVSEWLAARGHPIC